MFDLSRVTEMIGGLLGQQSGNAEDMLSQHLGDLGIDPGLLDGISGAEAIDLLSQHGIDVSQLAPEQLSVLLGQLDPNAPIAELLSGLLSRQSGSG